MTINAINIIPTKADSCPTMGDAAIRKKMTVPWAKRKKGDIVLFDFNHNGTSDHIGVIVAVNKNGSIDTIEGNTSAGSNTNGGQVQKRTRYKSQVNFIVRPKYTKTITPAMLLATANSQVGIKESPKNSNKVKYNVWFYGSNRSAFWCCTFVCWLFAHLFEPVKKPTGKYSGTIPSGTLKKGSKGSKVKQLQAFLNWYHSAWKLTTDGEFGPKTANAVIIFQLTEGLTTDGVYGPKSYAKAKTYKAAAKPTTTAPKPAAKPAASKPKTTTPAKNGYTGAFPALNNNAKIVNGLAYRHCWPYGTPQKKYTYAKGKPTAAYKKGIDKAYPKHKSWPNKKQRAGACCDVFVGEVLGHVGVKVSKDLAKQLVEMPKMTTKLKSNGHHTAKAFKAGDVVQRGRKDKSGHTWIVCELVNGKRYVANAHYKKLKGTYAVMDAVPKNIVPSKWKYYKCYTVLGAVRTYYQKGDYGSDVKYAQGFLKWAGYYKGTLDGDFGSNTETAVKAFQIAQKLTQNGKIDKSTIAKMKSYKK